MTVAFQGRILGVQPRIRLTRSFDERHHAYLGFVVRLAGQVAGEVKEFTIGIGPAAHAKHQFRAGGDLTGLAQFPAEPDQEAADLHKVASVRYNPSAPSEAPQPPWHTLAPDLATYRDRGHRRLAAATYDRHCRTCTWGCRMPVEMIIDQWNPDVRRHRLETFCYGPKACGFYRAGPTRRVPGRRGMTWEEEDWVDEEATAHRGPDD